MLKLQKSPKNVKIQLASETIDQFDQENYNPNVRHHKHHEKENKHKIRKILKDTAAAWSPTKRTLQLRQETPPRTSRVPR